MAVNRRSPANTPPGGDQSDLPVDEIPVGTDSPNDPPKVISLTSKKDREEIKTVPLFSIDGKEYSAPAEVPLNVGLKYGNIARRKGEEAAADYMLEQMLGEEGYEALINFDDLSEDDFKNVLEACQNIMVGAVNKGKAKRTKRG